ncbi:DUF4386 domain-containing protein [Dokdonella soli]|uniref:DUF4386 domain-containing protein n=1 Tax=Dokdonella soli TaxID=529810 RepID=A0ABN1IZP3_9GAMM
MSTIVHSPKVAGDIHAPRAWARVAGVCWLIAIAGGLFAEAFVRARLITHDSLTTIQNILANEAMYRLGLAAMVVGTATYLALTAIMYRLLAPVNRTVSLIAAFFSIAGCAIWMLTLVSDAAPLVFFAGVVGSLAPEAAQMQAPAFALLRLHPELLLLGMLCFGVQCLLMGCLIVRATFLPKLLGVILAVGGIGYLAAGFLHILAPPLAEQFGRYAFVPGEAGEALMGLWLTLVGVNARKWKLQSGLAEEAA